MPLTNHVPSVARLDYQKAGWATCVCQSWVRWRSANRKRRKPNDADAPWAVERLTKHFRLKATKCSITQGTQRCVQTTKRPSACFTGSRTVTNKSAMINGNRRSANCSCGLRIPPGLRHFHNIQLLNCWTQGKIKDKTLEIRP